MKIVSWNIFRNNFGALSRSSKIILKQDPDVICFQEFPANKLNLLERIYFNYNIFYGKDFFINENKKKNKYFYYNIIMVKKSLNVVKVDKIEHIRPLVKSDNYLKNSNFYLYFKKFTKFENESVFVDLLYKNKQIRIINSHFFAIAPPSVRINQFKEVLNFLLDNTILIGDFNTFGDLYNKKFISPLLKQFSGVYSKEDNSINDSFEIQKISLKNGFENPFEKIRTFTYFSKKTQIDYILIPGNLKLVEKKILIKNFTLSDHFCLFLEFSF